MVWLLPITSRQPKHMGICAEWNIWGAEPAAGAMARPGFVPRGDAPCSSVVPGEGWVGTGESLALQGKRMAPAPKNWRGRC